MNLQNRATWNCARTRKQLLLATLLGSLVACLPTRDEVERRGGGGGDDTAQTTQSDSIRVQPSRLNFLVESEDPMVKHFTITNMGDAILAVMDIALSGSSDFSIPDENRTEALETGESMQVDVQLTPSGEEANGEVIISSTDADAPVVLVDLYANAWVPDGPVAVCSVSPEEVQPLEAATWVGDASFDPTGAEIIDWSWSLLSSPAGSTATMPEGSANRSGFLPNVGGEYIGELIVTNEEGVESAPCITTLSVYPSGLWIEMYWTHSGDDMDLHLIAPGGSYQDIETDCHWRNCSGAGLNWGDQASTDDDPSLVLDDITGTGPEAIDLTAPENGTYTIAVHDYPGSDYSGSNAVTVNVYIHDGLVWTDTRAISGEDTVNYFAEISWVNGNGTVNGL